MGFLPHVKMRVMVREEDFDESVKIIDSMAE
jgi:nitrogen regulatory protein PII